MTDIKLPPLPEGYDKYDPPLLYDGQMFVEGQMRSYARAAVLADRQQRGGDVIDDMRAAVRFAPSSAYWSERLREFFGPDAREGIDALEKQLQEARAALAAQPAASAELRCRKCGELARVVISSAQVMTHWPDGSARDERDIASDPEGTLIHDPSEPLRAAARDRTLRLADECEESARLWAHEIDTRQRAAAELRRLHVQSAQDEALLQQTLEALSCALQTAMEQSMKARIPECGEFSRIAQDLDFVVAALRERLGEKT